MHYPSRYREERDQMLARRRLLVASLLLTAALGYFLGYAFDVRAEGDTPTPNTPVALETMTPSDPLTPADNTSEADEAITGSRSAAVNPTGGDSASDNHPSSSGGGRSHKAELRKLLPLYQEIVRLLGLIVAHYAALR